VLLILHHLSSYPPHLVQIYLLGREGLIVSVVLDGRAGAGITEAAGRTSRIAEMEVAFILLFLGVVVSVVSDRRARARTSRRPKSEERGSEMAEMEATSIPLFSGVLGRQGVRGVLGSELT
jgi:membrane protein implicated in regulation of membrane protease activity